MSPLVIQAPTDAQLVYIRNLAARLGEPYPESIASKTEAVEIIDALKNGTYEPGRYAYPFSMSDEQIPFSERRELAEALADGEYAYVIGKLGENALERLFGVSSPGGGTKQ